MFLPSSTSLLFQYDRDRRRIWILNQRIHHGMTGALLLAAGTVLMLHDWKDRAIWFQPGRQHQP